MISDLSTLRRLLRRFTEEQASTFIRQGFAPHMHNRLWALWYVEHEAPAPNYLRLQYELHTALDMPRLMETHTPDQIADLIKFAVPEQQAVLKRQLCGLLRQRRALPPRPWLEVVNNSAAHAR